MEASSLKEEKEIPDFDGKAARQLITDLFSFLHTITKIWADSGCSGPELSDWLWHTIRVPDRGR